jgi:hypothetical protein
LREREEADLATAVTRSLDLMREGRQGRVEEETGINGHERSYSSHEGDGTAEGSDPTVVITEEARSATDAASVVSHEDGSNFQTVVPRRDYDAEIIAKMDQLNGSSRYSGFHEEREVLQAAVTMLTLPIYCPRCYREVRHMDYLGTNHVRFRLKCPDRGYLFSRMKTRYRGSLPTGSRGRAR